MVTSKSNVRWKIGDKELALSAKFPPGTRFSRRRGKVGADQAREGNQVYVAWELIVKKLSVNRK